MITHSSPRSRCSGFTLIEVVVSIALLSFFLLSVFGVFGLVLEAQIDSLATAHIEQTGQYTLARLRHDILSADTLIIPANPGEISSVLELSTDAGSVVYRLTAGNLVLERSGASYQVNGVDTRVTQLVFRRLGGATGSASVQVHLELESVLPETSGPEVRTYQQTVTLR